MRYHENAYDLSVHAAVRRCEPAPGGVEVLLSDTVLFPEGGGQPSDHGYVAGRPARAVRREEAGVVHLVEGEGALEGDVAVTLDWARRFDHMQQHSGQHLLSAIAQDRFGWPTIAFHLGPERCDVELDGAPDADGLVLLQAAVNAAIRDAHPVRTRVVSTVELSHLPVRTRGLPDGHVGPVRLVEIDGVDLNTCGGTHVRTTAELQAVAFVGTERLKRGTRLHFLAGGRVLGALQAGLAREAALTRALTCGPADHVAAVERALDEAKSGAKALRAVAGELARAIGATLEPGDGRVVYHRDDGDPAFLAGVAEGVLARHPAALFIGTAGVREGVFLVAGPPDLVAVEGPALAARVEGRGGGKGRFQGKGARIDRRGG